MVDSIREPDTPSRIPVFGGGASSAARSTNNELNKLKLGSSEDRTNNTYASPSDAAKTPTTGAKLTQRARLADDHRAYFEGLAARRSELDDETFRRLTSTKETFLDVLTQASESAADTNPIGFLQTLTPRELTALQYQHGLADPIRPEDLTFEGAFNLLQMPDQGRDLNRDGLIHHGISGTITFPPANAPQEVLDAWDEATKGMDHRTKMTMQLSMWTQAGGIERFLGNQETPMKCYSESFDWKAFALKIVELGYFSQQYQTSGEARKFSEGLVQGYESFLKHLQLSSTG
jgi:hypothetical protein